MFSSLMTTTWAWSRSPTIGRRHQEQRASAASRGDADVAGDRGAAPTLADHPDSRIVFKVGHVLGRPSATTMVSHSVVRTGGLSSRPPPAETDRLDSLGITTRPSASRRAPLRVSAVAKRPRAGLCRKEVMGTQPTLPVARRPRNSGGAERPDVETAVRPSLRPASYLR